MHIRIFRMLAIYMLTFLLPAPCLAIGHESVEKSLYTDLFANYSSKLRPIAGSNYYQQVVVTIQFGLEQVEKLNEKDQHLTSHGFMSLGWRDELLQWNPADYNNAHFIIVPSTDVWIPEITAINSVDDADELAFEKEDTRVRIDHNGTISWVPYIHWSTSCPVDVTKFPYDQQECLIQYANWMYTSSLVNFTAVPEVLLEKASSEWSILTATAFTDKITGNGNTTFPVVMMKIRMQRVAVYFELNVLLPAVLLSFLLIPMFILPVESGEKVSLGVTLMLSYSIFLLMMTDYTPRSGTLPDLSIAILVCIVFSGLGMFGNIIIINLHYHLPNKAVPGWLKVCVLGRLSRLLCGMNYGTDAVAPNQVEPGEVCDESKSKPRLLLDSLTHTDIAKILEYLEFFRTKLLDEDQVEKNREDWNKVARVLDRFLLIVYFIAFLIYVFGLIGLKFAA